MGLTTGKDFGDLLGLMGFGKTKRVNQSNRTFPYEEGFITSSDVYSVTSKIAKNGKAIKWILKKNTGGKIEEITEGELYDLIQNPNDKQSREEFVELALLFLLLSGEVFEKNNYVLGFENSVTSVNLINPQLIDLEVKEISGVYKLKNYYLKGRKEPLESDDITHLKYANPTLEGVKSLRGLSPLVAGYLTLIGLNNNQEANASILENQGAAGILSNENENTLTSEERNQAQGVLDGLIAKVRNFGKIIQSSSKVKYTRLGLDPTQLKIIESKLLKFRDLCSVYDIKSILFNDPVNASFNNLTNAEKQFWTNSVIPNTQLIVNMFTDGVLSKFNEDLKGNSFYYIELDIKSIIALQSDQKKEAEKDRVKMEGIDKILNMPISSVAKVELLVKEYDYTKEEAEIIVLPNGKQNEQLEILSSLSPLLANKLIEKLSEEEVRALLGLK